MSKFKTQYSKTKNRISLNFQKPSRTMQAPKAECDINTIMSKYQKTGLLTHVNEHQGQYADLGDSVDFQMANNHLIAANESFQSLPSSLRKKFDNDPAQFLDFVNDPKNIQEMQKMGLTKTPYQKPTPETPPTLPEAPNPTSSKPQPTTTT